MKRLIFILLCIVTIIISCDRIADQLEINRPKIVSISPAHLSENITQNVKIIVIFSKEMDRIKTNQAFSLKAHKTGNVEGYFVWHDGKTLEFSPRIPLLDNCYTIRIESSAEDIKGNDLQEAHESVFYVNIDLTPPEIVYHTPANNAIGIHPSPWDDPERYRTSFIRVIFSEPIDVNSLYSGFAIMPAVPGTFLWNDARTEITFIPIHDLLVGTMYTITLNTSLTDIHGNTLSENYSYRFTVGDDFTPPEIISVLSESKGSNAIELIEDKETEGCEKDARIAITFSEPVMREKLREAVRISPQKSFYVDAPLASTLMEIVFYEPLESETPYELSIMPSLTDTHGNPLLREYRYRFITNGAASTRPKPVCITDTHHGFVEPYENDYECFEKDAIEPVTIYTSDEFMYIIFNKSIKPERMNLTITRVHGSSGSGLPKVINIDWPKTPFGEFHVYKFFLTGIDANNIYRLTIRGGDSGIEDFLGNRMKEDYHQFIKVHSK